MRDNKSISKCLSDSLCINIIEQYKTTTSVFKH